MYFKATDEGPTIKVCNTNKFSLKSVLILFPNIVSYDIVVFLFMASLLPHIPKPKA